MHTRHRLSDGRDVTNIDLIFNQQQAIWQTVYTNPHCCPKRVACGCPVENHRDFPQGIEQNYQHDVGSRFLATILFRVDHWKPDVHIMSHNLHLLSNGQGLAILKHMCCWLVSNAYAASTYISCGPLSTAAMQQSAGLVHCWQQYSLVTDPWPPGLGRQ